MTIVNYDRPGSKKFKKIFPLFAAKKTLLTKLGRCINHDSDVEIYDPGMGFFLIFIFSKTVLADVRFF